jgi:hypothetical protein
MGAAFTGRAVVGDADESGVVVAVMLRTGATGAAGAAVVVA